ncbi:thiamine diphosphokinase [Lapidilactobacillus bayanensis]|uniref:thiamine diphosphokinase n=1 Tax=Lapidilactobacillus bayanensis TaxID=2485998 RepID=UPI000F78034E|nr:thiamine diphosphokinase [Lapidilactobacillus bayanensis]
MSEKVVNIMLGGPTALIPIDEIKRRRGETWLGVDHGIIYLLNQQIKPVIAVGDYDSLAVVERQQIETQVADIRYAKAEKDFTDSQMSVITAFVDLKATQVNIFGATGGRIDHSLVNLFMMTDPRFQAWLQQVTIIDEFNQVTFYPSGNYQLPYQAGYQYLAFANLTPVKNLTLRQVRYELTDFSADNPVSWSSNEFIRDKPACFNFTAGIVAVILSHD